MSDQKQLEALYAEHDKHQARVDEYVTSRWENLEDVDIVDALYLSDLSGLTAVLRDPDIDGGYLRDEMIKFLEGHFREEALYEMD